MQAGQALPAAYAALDHDIVVEHLVHPTPTTPTATSTQQPRSRPASAPVSRRAAAYHYSRPSYSAFGRQSKRRQWGARLPPARPPAYSPLPPELLAAAAHRAAQQAQRATAEAQREQHSTAEAQRAQRATAEAQRAQHVTAEACLQHMVQLSSSVESAATCAAQGPAEGPTLGPFTSGGPFTLSGPPPQGLSSLSFAPQAAASFSTPAQSPTPIPMAHGHAQPYPGMWGAAPMRPMQPMQPMQSGKRVANGAQPDAQPSGELAYCMGGGRSLSGGKRHPNIPVWMLLSSPICMTTALLIIFLA